MIFEQLLCFLLSWRELQKFVELSNVAAVTDDGQGCLEKGIIDKIGKQGKLSIFLSSKQPCIKENKYIFCATVH